MPQVPLKEFLLFKIERSLHPQSTLAVHKTLGYFFSREKEIYEEGVKELRSLIGIWAKKPISEERFKQLQELGRLSKNSKFENSDLGILSYVNLSEVNLQEADLIGANIQEADLIGANLQGANLNEANLKDAWLCRADVSAALGITTDSLKDAKSLYKIKNLDAKIQTTLSNQHPHLFKPQRDFFECYD